MEKLSKWLFISLVALGMILTGCEINVSNDDDEEEKEENTAPVATFNPAKGATVRGNLGDKIVISVTFDQAMNTTGFGVSVDDLQQCGLDQAGNPWINDRTFQFAVFINKMGACGIILKKEGFQSAKGVGISADISYSFVVVAKSTVTPGSTSDDEIEAESGALYDLNSSTAAVAEDIVVSGYLGLSLNAEEKIVQFEIQLHGDLAGDEIIGGHVRAVSDDHAIVDLGQYAEKTQPDKAGGVGFVGGFPLSKKLVDELIAAAAEGIYVTIESQNFPEGIAVASDIQVPVEELLDLFAEDEEEDEEGAGSNLQTDANFVEIPLNTAVTKTTKERTALLKFTSVEAGAYTISLNPVPAKLSSDLRWTLYATPAFQSFEAERLQDCDNHGPDEGEVCAVTLAANKKYYIVIQDFGLTEEASFTIKVEK